MVPKGPPATNTGNRQMRGREGGGGRTPFGPTGSSWRSRHLGPRPPSGSSLDPLLLWRPFSPKSGQYGNRSVGGRAAPQLSALESNGGPVGLPAHGMGTARLPHGLCVGAARAPCGQCVDIHCWGPDKIPGFGQTYARCDAVHSHCSISDCVEKGVWGGVRCSSTAGYSCCGRPARAPRAKAPRTSTALQTRRCAILHSMGRSQAGKGRHSDTSAVAHACEGA